MSLGVKSADSVLSVFFTCSSEQLLNSVWDQTWQKKILNNFCFNDRNMQLLYILGFIYDEAIGIIQHRQHKILNN